MVEAREPAPSGGHRRPAIFTVPLHRPFADALAAGIVRLHGGDPLALAGGMLVLPNHRAVTAVRDAFIRLAGGALLLPRLVALGDEDLDAGAGGALDRIDLDDPLPPAIDPMRRRFILARMVTQERPETPAGEALRLADGLAAAFDQLAIEDVSPDALRTLQAEAGMAAHWEAAFALLRRLCERWPEELARIGALDRAVRRNRLFDATAKAWAAQGLPARFVIAAGVSTAAPAVTRLLSVIARADGGMVVLPHVDTGMAAEQWDALGMDPRRAAREDVAANALETHPQFHLKLLLDRMDIHRDEVAVWPDRTPGDGPSERGRVVRHLLAPAQFTHDWPDLPAAERRLPGVVVHGAATPAEEALAIALAMREALETPGKTAALVTPDRVIAARVAGHLERWGIVADDSAGRPLDATPPGELALALVAAAGSGFAPVALLALLTHPLVASGEGRLAWLDRVRELDLALRGPRPGPGLAALDAHLAGEKDGRKALREWLAQAVGRMHPLAEVTTRPATLAELLPRLRETIDAFAGDAAWAGAAGRALAALIDALESHAAEFPAPLALHELSPVLRQAMRDVAVRPPQGGHPRLFIWGLLEARLQRADRMILAGLNEGQWPQPTAPDPWLAPMVRRRLGLPGLDRQVGLSAHDFAGALGGGEVLLFRSLREGSAPTVPSRLRLRIDALLGDARSLRPTAEADFIALARTLDACAAPRPVARPAPCPDADRRPRRISVTEVDTLIADPFAWYARAGLGLRTLDPLDADPTAGWRGTAVHDVLERWLKGDDRTVSAIERLAHELLERPGVNPLLRTLWAPRLIAPLRWAAEEIIAQIQAGRVPLVEASEQRRSIDVDGGVILSGTPDRIDRNPDGTIAIVDYKTGSGPTKKSVDALFALQLGLLAAMAEHGAFTNKPEQVADFEYWRMNRPRNGDGFGWVDSPFKKGGQVTADNFAGEAWGRFIDHVERYMLGDAPFVAKLRPEYAIYGDYDQLMRLEEWYGQEAAAGKLEAEE